MSTDTTTTGDQLTLDFHGTEADPDALAAEKAAAEAAYDAMVEQLRVTVGRAKQHGLWLRASESGPPGERNKVTVLVCPACGTWEANDWHIGNNHGITLAHFERRDDGTWDTGTYGPQWCLALDLTSCHVAGDHRLSDRQNRMLAGLRDDVRARFNQRVTKTREVIAARQAR